MAGWDGWFGSLADKVAEKGGHFIAARKFSKSGMKELGWHGEPITGYCVIDAECLDEAEKIAQGSVGKIGGLSTKHQKVSKKRVHIRHRLSVELTDRTQERRHHA